MENASQTASNRRKYRYLNKYPAAGNARGPGGCQRLHAARWHARRRFSPSRTSPPGGHRVLIALSGAAVAHFPHRCCEARSAARARATELLGSAWRIGGGRTLCPFCTLLTNAFRPVLLFR